MNRASLKKLFSHFPLLDELYNLSFIKNIYQRFFLSNLTEPQYYIELSNVCNAECVFCSYPAIRKSGKKLSNINDEIFDRSIEFIKQHKRQTVSLTPTTGEVFIDPQWQKHLQTILDLDFVEYVHFYTNAALLNGQNRKKLFQLRGFEKVSMSFSTGGIDKITYRLLFGKDLFHEVKSNINAFLSELHHRGLKIRVSVDIKLPKDQICSIADAKRTYNQCGYKYAFIKTRKAFDNLSGLIAHSSLDVIKPISSRRHQRPCAYLNDIRFAANGEVWLCGCVISELPGNEDLKIGHLNDLQTSQEILERQKDISGRWSHDRIIPHNCQECTWYVAR